MQPPSSPSQPPFTDLTLNPSVTQRALGQTAQERIRARLELVNEQATRDSQEQRMHAIRTILRDETAAILGPALQDAMAMMTLQFQPDPKLGLELERTGKNVGRLAEEVVALAKAQTLATQATKDTTDKIAEVMDQMVTETVTTMQNLSTKSTDSLLQEQKAMAKRQKFWTLATAGLMTVLLLAAALGVLGYLRWEQRSKVATQLTQLEEQKAKALAELNQAKIQFAETQGKQADFNQNLEKLRAEETALRLQVKQTADTMNAMSQTRSQAQTDVRKLQELQEKNRFRLIQGQEGAVFVEILPNTQPFSYGGKTYVKLPE